MLLIAKRLLVFCMTVGLVFLWPTQAVQANDLEEIDAEIASLTEQEEQLLKDLIALETAIERNTQELADLNEKLDQAQAEYDKASQDAAEIKTKLEEQSRLLNKRAVEMYKDQDVDLLLRLIFSADLMDLLNRANYIRILVDENAQLVEDYKELKEKYESAYKEMEEKRDQIAILRDEAQREQERLSQDYEAKKDLVTTIKRQKKELVNKAQQIMDKIKEIQPVGITLSGKVFTMVATAYYAGGGGLCGDGITATGLRAAHGIVAVDPRVIPLGTKLYIPGYGPALAADTGGWIKGNRIDLCFNSREQAIQWGRRTIKVYVVE
jgi:3D (Asp-Asp-Asp) domain-containing protein/peptidoglycan hydrolase CwlO-like protein